MIQKLNNWKNELNPIPPSKRRQEVQNLSKTLSQYNKLKRKIIDENRKTKFANNRWRENIGKVIKSKDNIDENSIKQSQRHTAANKFYKKNQQNIDNVNSKFE